MKLNNKIRWPESIAEQVMPVKEGEGIDQNRWRRGGLVSMLPREHCT